MAGVYEGQKHVLPSSALGGGGAKVVAAAVILPVQDLLVNAGVMAG